MSGNVPPGKVNIKELQAELKNRIELSTAKILKRQTGKHYLTI
jgi:hypothetical protein